MTDPRDDADGAGPPPDEGTTDGPRSAEDGSAEGTESGDDGTPSGDGSSETDSVRADDPLGSSANATEPEREGGRFVDSADARDSSGGERTDSADSGTVVAESVETPGEPRTLDPRVRYNWIVGPLIGATAVALLAGAATWFAGYEFLPAERQSAAVGVMSVVFLLLAAYGVFKVIYRYRSWRYVVRDESLYLTRGVFTKVQTVVPYVRVQHIDTRRSAFERVLGLSTLVVYTAGSRGADVTVPGLLPETAEDLQSRLERLAIESEDEDAV
jgi:membrane protein YdbS with pleckstrin-like domain